MTKNFALYNEMVALFAGDARRCQHFIKVASLAKQLAESEGADAELTELVEAAGLVHDCGIKPGEDKYGAGHCTGKIQEQEGPAVARGLLQKVGYTPEKIERICYLVGHHHT
ncbi:HD domain-containing protein, partial [Phascolarctobacterium succinatutens]|uniref:HD domain-containing protein n=1 Tax=Phascolarctobacterium succinatutens TaxID=626940 RepID=UPI0026EB4477